MTKNTFIFTGNGPAMNHGCEAILRSTVKLLEKEFPDSQFINSPEKQGIQGDEVFYRHPKVTHLPFQTDGMQFHQRVIRFAKKKLGTYSIYPFESQLKKCSAVLALGGDNFTLDYGPKMPMRQLDAGDHVQSKGKPFIIWGASIGPFSQDPEFEKRVAERLKRPEMLTIREQYTVDYLSSIGVSENVVRVADPAFHLDCIEPTKLDASEHHLEERPIGLNLSPLLARYLTKEKWEELAYEMLVALDQVVDRPIVLIPHVTWEITNDHEFLESLLKRLPKTKNPISLIPDWLNATELKWVISKLSLLCAARTHATIASLSQCVPTLSIGYSSKSVGINQDLFGHQNWLIDSKTMTASSFAEKALDTFNNGFQITDHLKGKIPEYKKLSSIGAEAIRNLIT